MSAAALLFTCHAALADSVSWVGTTSSDWFEDSNWAWGNHAPTSADLAYINELGVVLDVYDGAANTLYVGTGSEGDLTVRKGLATTDTVLGNSAGAKGTVTVSGTPASWANSGNAYIGNDGTGTLKVETGRKFLGGVVYLGAGTTGIGTLEVSNQSQFEASTLYVGYAGSGTFVLEEAATAETGLTTIADGIGSSGTVTVSTVSTWTLSDQLTIGGGGIGTLLIEEGADVTGTSAVIGVGSDADGSSVTVSGADTSWINTGALFVGVFGDSTLDILAGATVQNGATVIGRHSTASVTVSGSGSSWTTGALQIGGDRSDTSSAVPGDGTLEILADATVDSTTAVLGDSTGSTGQVTVDGSGSLWDVSGTVSVGGYGAGTVSITNGGTITSASGLIGHEASGSGTVTITGDGSLWDNSGVFYVGNVGDGTLDILAGGDLASTDGYVGTEDGSDSEATVSGTGSTWINSGDFFVGHNDGARGSVTISAGGTIESLQGILGDLSGAYGDLTVTGDGSLWDVASDLNVGRIGEGDLTIALGGDVMAGRSLIGNNVGSVGTATVSGTGSTWTTSGDLYVGNEGTGTLTISGGGSVSADEITIANDTGSTGTLIVGAALGQTAGGTGSFDANAIHFGDGDGSLVFNFGGSAFSFDASIDGDGDIAVSNGTVVYAGNGSAFTGTTEISGGTFEIGGTLGGTLSVSGWGTLSGTGTVGSTTIASYATVTPGGDNVGTLTVNGNLIVASGATYEVDVNPDTGASDRIHATGTATLTGGSVLQVGPSSGYSAARTYTILTADSGLTGTFGSVSSDYSFLDASLGYDSTAVTLTLTRNATDFDDIAVNDNQAETAGAVENLGSGNAIYDAIVVLDDDTASEAFQQLSGEVYSSSVGVSFANSGTVRTLGLDRVRSAFGTTGAKGGNTLALGSGSSRTGSGAALAYGEDNQRPKTAAEQAAESILVEPATSGPVAWAEAYGGWGKSDGENGNASISNAIGGLAFGVDTVVGDTTWRLGVMGGYGHATFELSDGLSSGDSDDFDIGLYGGNQWGPVALRFGALYKHQQVSTERTVDFTGFTDDLSADYGTNTVQGYVELGYEVKHGETRFEPFANLAQIYMHTPAFTEEGGAASLSRAASDMNVTLTNLGLRAATDLNVGGVATVLRGAASWQHAFGDTETLSTLSFAGGNDFVTSSKTIAENSLGLQAGMDFALGTASTVSLSYDGNFSSSGHAQTVKLNFARQF